MSAEGLAQAEKRMAEHGEDDLSVRAFASSYGQLEQILQTGSGGVVPEDTIEPLTDVPTPDDVDLDEAALAEALGQVAVVKLNGGLGTSMGITGPKSALPVKDGLSFLDVICRQVLALRERYGVALPLVLMDSFRTREESLEILHRYPDLEVEGLPLDFLQSAEPKLRADDLTPVDHPADPALEWCPPGHGDVYVSLQRTGILDTLLERGIRYVFLSNADNLGATCDPRIAAWIVANDVPYVAEVCERTVNDRKGGHLAVRKADGRLVLRDSAMVAPGEDHFFQDTSRHTTFHANNLWVDLRVVKALLDDAQERGEVGLGLPVIVNRKTVDPSDASSTEVIQIETAMGAAIEKIEGARALFVPRDRFRPVKTTNELLLVRSDIFELDEHSSVVSTIDHPDPYVDLDKPFKLVPAFEERFAHGVPSLKQATRFVVEGDVHFGADVVVVGDVTVDGADTPRVADGTRLQG
ncbi:UTP--glucose-1-phosphate uridylyltransferase [Lapillicoccus jejuensis]|uniref:UTP--glucose-1-phosphate uridylyltransferase n=1 Tax=Lapillicoccus jejuensis TaxID=402171 RepID=A0A542E171_9MICO|nr:UTP--glucose-1-phosphate uridylyltransferase [Lapillicoccus jejuensis]TQJ09086.1 UTP--glucose-1-phosphate uridylyltransferase [Lapillicoccus jejuensis]